MPNMHKNFNSNKIKYRAPFVRLKPCLVYLASLQQMNVELMDELTEAHGGASSRCKFCTKHGMTLRYDV